MKETMPLKGVLAIATATRLIATRLSVLVLPRSRAYRQVFSTIRRLQNNRGMIMHLILFT